MKQKLRTEINLTIAITLKVLHISIKPIRKSLVSSKTEAAGVLINEFISLRSKMYSYIKDNQKGGKTAKGIKKNIVKNDTKHEDYKNVLLNEKQLHHKIKTIRSKKHQLGNYEINKVSLSCFDDKRYIHENGITSYAYGHYKINQINLYFFICWYP